MIAQRQDLDKDRDQRINLEIMIDLIQEDMEARFYDPYMSPMIQEYVDDLKLKYKTLYGVEYKNES